MAVELGFVSTAAAVAFQLALHDAESVERNPGMEGGVSFQLRCHSSGSPPLASVAVTCGQVPKNEPFRSCPSCANSLDEVSIGSDT